MVSLNRLGVTLAERYVHHIEDVHVEIHRDGGSIEILVGFTLRSDQKVRTLTLTVEADPIHAEARGEFMTIALFYELEEQIQSAIWESVFQQLNHN